MFHWVASWVVTGRPKLQSRWSSHSPATWLLLTELLPRATVAATMGHGTSSNLSADSAGILHEDPWSSWRVSGYATSIVLRSHTEERQVVSWGKNPCLPFNSWPPGQASHSPASSPCRPPVGFAHQIQMNNSSGLVLKKKVLIVVYFFLI